MKIAIFHDYFRVIGGGEKLVLTMARHLKADVITTDCDRSLITKMGFGDVNVISLGSLVNVAPLKMIQATIKFALCDFSRNYDFYIFSGNWAHYASREHMPCLFYCHTPVRAFYDRRDAMIASMGPIAKVAFRGWTSIHSYFDRQSVGRISRIVCNSQNTAMRIKKYLGVDASIVYPPVDTSKYHYIDDNGYWLSVNRLYPEKRVEVQIEAFRRMPREKLVIIGNCGAGDHSAEYARRLKRDLPSNITVISDVTEEVLIDYYGRCRGLITTAEDEDFGMTAIEAMASGKPVIAVAEGGYLESVVDGETGLLIARSPEAIIEAVRALSVNPGIYRTACENRSKMFDTATFNSKVEAEILATFNGGRKIE